MTVKHILALLLFASLAAPAIQAQNTGDQAIREEFDQLMKLLEAPQDRQLEESVAKARAERFQNDLGFFLSRWVERTGELSEGYYILGKAQAMGGRVENAIHSLKKFMEINPGHADFEDAWLTLGTTELDASRYGEAQATLQRFLGERSGSERLPVARFYLGIASYQLGQTGAAVDLLRQVAAAGGEGPLAADAQLKIVEMLLESGKADEARKELEPLLAAEPEAPYLKSLREQMDWIGKPAPEWVDMQSWPIGPPTTVKESAGKVLVVSFFADRYEACQDEVRALAQMQARMTGDQVRFAVLTRYYRPLDQMPQSQQDAQFVRLWGELKSKIPLGVSSSFKNLRNYGVRGIPHTVVIGRDGIVKHVKIGGSRKNPRSVTALEEAIQRSL